MQFTIRIVAEITDGLWQFRSKCWMERVHIKRTRLGDGIPTRPWGRQ